MEFLTAASRKFIETRVKDLKGLKLPDKELYQQALDNYVKKNISFVDAFNATFILKKGIKEIYSYDEDFDKIRGIKRVTPSK